MAFLHRAWWLCLAALPLGAGTIDVSAQSSVVLHDGDSLSFTISEWSYSVHAGAYGAPSSPAQISFSLLTEPLAGGLELSAELESGSGGATAPAGNVGLTAGYFQGSLYQGPATTAYDSIPLSQALSSQVFAGPAALLVLTDTGGDVTLGLPPYTLLQDLQVSLSGGALSVGATVAAVGLDRAPTGSSDMDAQFLAGSPDFGAGLNGADLPAGDPSGNDPADTPEPQPAALLALGGALLWWRRRSFSVVCVGRPQKTMACPTVVRQAE